MKKNGRIYCLCTLTLIFFYGCKNNEVALSPMHFSLLKKAETGIDFKNQITESDSVNVYLNEYMYNGSGVGIGDFNNDSLPDIFFCGSMVSSRLFINKGNFKFEDITEAAGLQTNEWSTGVSIVDINGDGFTDIYVCASHSPAKEKRRNMLFINDGHLHFTDQAAGYGLADTGYSTQAAFIDYDKDGDLDMYLLNHRLYNKSPNNLVQKDTSGNSPAQDRLYRNDGMSNGVSHPVFHDISTQAGIKEDGYGLGVVVTDVDNDNWPDIYVANDYIGNDLLWRNNHDGTFTNIIASSIRHQSFNSMGVDAADINNDGLPDLAVLDMSPENNERKKMMFNGSSQERYDMERRMGYEPGFVRNMLQLNNGLRSVNNRIEPFYSEIGQFASISETDWSWSVLIADFDNDGWKDIHITNGLAKDVTNTDYVSFKNSLNQDSYSFNSESKNAGSADPKIIKQLRNNLDLYGSVRPSNYLFRNSRDLSFSDATVTAGLSIPSISNGAAYADLDNDGDLDLVINNMNEDAFVWRNEIRKDARDTLNNFLTIDLKGPKENNYGFGTKISIYYKGMKQFLEQATIRGFSSSVDSRLHFGLGATTIIDSLVIEWPDDKIEVLEKLKSNQLVTIDHASANTARQTLRLSNDAFLFTDLSSELSNGFAHSEGQFFDFGSQRGVPQKYSQLGPCLASTDVNNDGLADFFVGGAAGQSGKIFVQERTGLFKASDLVKGPKIGEDLGAVFLDYDNDKDQDLLITGGSPEFGSSLSYNQPRLFANDGKGNFMEDLEALPKDITCITSAVAVVDWDSDGDMDVFIGGRLLPQKYPQSPGSYLLRNDRGHFKDVTYERCPALQFPGMITAAVFAGMNNDKIPDLIIDGEWMPVRLFINSKGVFTETTQQSGLKNATGQWRSLSVGDIDEDGDMDIVAGNMGLNNKFHNSPERPIKLYSADFDNNNSQEIIPAYYIKNEKGNYDLYPGLDRIQLADQLPSVKKKYLLNSIYSKITMSQLINDLNIKNLDIKECATMATVWIENLGTGQFKLHQLPAEAQFAPVNSIVAEDLDGDGKLDLLFAGNEYQTEVVTGRYDASYGLFLKGNGKGDFKSMRPADSGFIIDGDVKCLLSLKTKEKKMIVAAVNNSSLKYFSIRMN